MCDYFLKADDEASEAMKQTAKEALVSSKSDYENRKLILKAYSTKRQCSVQEAAYLVMPKLWLRRIFPPVFF